MFTVSHYISLHSSVDRSYVYCYYIYIKLLLSYCYHSCITFHYLYHFQSCTVMLSMIWSLFPTHISHWLFFTDYRRALYFFSFPLSVLYTTSYCTFPYQNLDYFSHALQPFISSLTHFCLLYTYYIMSCIHCHLIPLLFMSTSSPLHMSARSTIITHCTYYMHYIHMTLVYISCYRFSREH